MQSAHRSLILYLTILFLAAMLLSSTTPSTASRSGLQPTRISDNVDLADLLGSWSGTWNDTIYSVGGSLSFHITEDAGVYSATGDIGLQALGLGLESGSATGNVQGGPLIFTFSSMPVGSGMGSIDATTGAASGSGSVVANGFGDFVFEGAVVGDLMSGMFDFTSPTGGAGVASLTRVGTAVEVVPWSGVKSRYREATRQEN